ncbi:MAG: hypothetical protein LUC88_08650 [Prevotella sp.]|nr:hypothetical protein [Prevotella sp.]
MSTSVEKKLKSHVLDDVTYTKAQVIWAKIGLVIGLWGVFATSLIILLICTKFPAVFGITL